MSTPKFDPDALMMNKVEALRLDIERLYGKDKRANELITELLYLFAWRIADRDTNKDQ